MLSKEEILDSAYVAKMHWSHVNRENVLKAMEQYAEQFKSSEEDQDVLWGEIKPLVEDGKNTELKSQYIIIKR